MGQFDASQWEERTFQGAGPIFQAPVDTGWLAPEYRLLIRVRSSLSVADTDVLVNSGMFCMKIGAPDRVAEIVGRGLRGIPRRYIILPTPPSGVCPAPEGLLMELVRTLPDEGGSRFEQELAEEWRHVQRARALALYPNESQLDLDGRADGSGRIKIRGGARTPWLQISLLAGSFVGAR